MKFNMLRRYKKIVNTGTKEGLDAIIVSSPENIFYVTGSYIGTQKRHPERLEICTLPINSDPIFLVCGIEEALVKETTWIYDVRSYVEFKESAIDMLCNILKEKKLDKGRIGVEINSPWSSYIFINSLFEKMNSAQFIACDYIFENLRAIKEPEEIEVLEIASQATRKAVEEGFAEAKIGNTEREIANLMKKKLFDYGADEIYFMLLGSGRRSNIVNPSPEDIKIQKGDIVRADLGGLFSGYYSDLARTAIAGNPSVTQSDVYLKMMDVHRRVIEHMRAGTKMRDLYFLCKKLFKERGIEYTFSHLGHGVGISSHDKPFINPINNESLEENMVLNVEPVLEYEGYSYHVEDLVVITHQGPPKILTGSSMEDKILRINEK